MSSPPKKGRFNLGKKLFEQYEAGQNVDTTVIVDDRKLFVHRNVLIGVSNEFRDKFREKQGSNVKNNDLTVIEFPTGISIEVAKAFIKVMYMQELDLDADFDQILAVLSLCDKYLVAELLLEDIAPSVRDKINVDNCVKVCEASFNLPRSQDILLPAGLVCLTRNIEAIFDRHGTTMTHKLWDRILQIEIAGPDVSVTIAESKLFENLLKWRQADESREEHFQKLLSFVRFPLMTLETISQIVAPSGVLCDTDLTDIYVYIIGGGINWNRTPRFVTRSRRIQLAKNSAELKEILKNAKPNDFIQLNPGEYVTKERFYIKTNVTLTGAADGTTTIKRIVSNKTGPAVCIESNDVQISNLRILSEAKNPASETVEAWGLTLLGSRNVVQNVTLENCTLYLPGRGRYNTISQVTCEKGEVGIMISGAGQAELSQNCLSDLRLKSLEIGIFINDSVNGTRLKDIHCTNVTTGVNIRSNDNIVSNLTYEFSKDGDDTDQIAVNIFRGSSNTVSNVVCGPANNSENMYAIKINKSDDSRNAKNNMINGCVGGEVDVGGEYNTLRSVDAGHRMIIRGEGHKLENCKAERCLNNDSTAVVLIECNFLNGEEFTQML